MNTRNLRHDCEVETRVKYSWTGYWQPHGVTYGVSHWKQPWELRRKFLSENWRFDKNGRKIQVI